MRSWNVWPALLRLKGICVKLHNTNAVVTAILLTCPPKQHVLGGIIVLSQSWKLCGSPLAGNVNSSTFRMGYQSDCTAMFRWWYLQQGCHSTLNFSTMWRGKLSQATGVLNDTHLFAEFPAGCCLLGKVQIMGLVLHQSSFRDDVMVDATCKGL